MTGPSVFDPSRARMSPVRGATSGPWARLGRMPWAVASIVGAALVVTLFAPDLVSGSEHEHLPLAAMLVWLWAAAAVVYVAEASRAAGFATVAAPMVATVAVIWGITALAATFGPELVTGSDPTHVPLTALAAPVFAALATGYVCLRAIVDASTHR